jgi:hypothetical protein
LSPHDEINNENTDRERDNLIFELIKRRFDGEGERTNSLDGKAGNLVGFISVVVGLFLGGGSLLSGGNISNSSALFSNHLLASLYFIGVGSLLLSIGSALCALRVRKWITVPNVNTLISDYVTLPCSEVLRRNAGEMAKAVSKTEEQNNSKAKFIEWSWYLLIAGLSIMFACAMIFAVTGSMIGVIKK